MIDYQQSYDHLLARKEPLMGFRLQQLSDDDKFVQALHFEVLERLCPRELVSELLSRCHAWEERERRLNHLIVV